jgi:hypothetical protein
MNDSPPWTTPSEIAEKLQRLWDRGILLAARLNVEPARFPMDLSLRRPDARTLGAKFDDARRWIQLLQDGSRSVRGFGYEIIWEDINHRQTGRNQIPKAVRLPSQHDALALIAKVRQADRFSRLAEASLSLFPALREWLARYPLAVLEHEAEWQRILTVLAWFRDHPRPGLYLRQLEIPGVDSKFIETHKGLLTELLDVVLPAEAIAAESVGARQFELRYGILPKPPLVRFRVLDPALHLGPLSDVATPPAQFARLELPVERVFITENDVNGLAFPPTPKSLVIFGLGYGLERLGDVTWLRDKKVFYWGDIDTHGFAMLDRLRASLPATASILMDRETLIAHRPLWSHEKAPHDGDLSRLTEAERDLYNELKADTLGPGVRLEQERIAYGWVKHALASR